LQRAHPCRFRAAAGRAPLRTGWHRRRDRSRRQPRAHRPRPDRAWR